MFQIFFAPDGSRQHTLDCFSQIQYWNDACWHRSIPLNAAGLTYLDVGSQAGIYCLRFEQRGGEATGLDFRMAAVIDDAKDVSEVGDEQVTNEDYQWVKQNYGAKYKVLSGGFDRDGSIVPNLGQFDIVSTINVLEYLPDPQACVKRMFEHARQRVILATDINPFGSMVSVSDLHPMKWVCGLSEVLSWIPWPTVHWVLDTKIEGHSRYQLFVVATKPGSGLAEVDAAPMKFDLAMSETEKFYRGR